MTSLPTDDKFLHTSLTSDILDRHQLDLSSVSNACSHGKCRNSHPIKEDWVLSLLLFVYECIQPTFVSVAASNLGESQMSSPSLSTGLNVFGLFVVVLLVVVGLGLLVVVDVSAGMITGVLSSSLPSGLPYRFLELTEHFIGHWSKGTGIILA